MAVRLQISNKELYDASDRRSAEAQMRRTSAIPISVMVVAFAIRYSAWALFAIAIPAFLFIRGLLLRQQSHDVLIQALTERVIVNT